jgi:hypothetical protein
MTKCVRIEATGQEGVREITATGWDGRVLRMGRDAFLKWRKAGGDKLGTACVYVLLADDFQKASANQRFLFVGHMGATPNVADSSDKDKPFWSVALVFTSAGAWMTQAHVQVIEQVFIEWAREAGRYDVAHPVRLEAAPPDDPCELVKAYLGPVRAVLEFAGVDVFQFNPEGLFMLSRAAKFSKLDKAKARIVSASSKTIEIYKDSRIGVNRLPETIEKVQALVDAGVATFDGETGVVTFKQPTRLSASGMFDTMLGTLPKDWTNRSRRSIRDVFAELKGPPAAMGQQGGALRDEMEAAPAEVEALD